MIEKVSFVITRLTDLCPPTNIVDTDFLSGHKFLIQNQTDSEFKNKLNKNSPTKKQVTMPLNKNVGYVWINDKNSYQSNY